MIWIARWNKRTRNKWYFWSTVRTEADSEVTSSFWPSNAKVFYRINLLAMHFHWIPQATQKDLWSRLISTELHRPWRRLNSITAQRNHCITWLSTTTTYSRNWLAHLHGLRRMKAYVSFIYWCNGTTQSERHIPDPARAIRILRVFAWERDSYKAHPSFQ